jgi:Leucine-rich repeat (LRR) protein
MNINTDYMSRLTSSEVYRVPYRKNDVNDEIFIKTIASNNSLTFLDISRCNILSSEAISSSFPRLKSLKYLDASFTALNDLSPLESSCPMLVSLNLSACTILDYSPLSTMTSLNLLCLRGSSFVDSELLSDLTSLRSLDLAHTHITSIDFLVKLNRLEEISIEGCSKLNQHYNSRNPKRQLLEVISKLSKIKVINLAETIFQDLDPAYIFKHHSILLHIKPKR